MRSRRNQKGSPIVEAICGGLLLTTVAMFMLNAVPIILASQMIAKVTFDAARAAASQPSADSGMHAAQVTLRKCSGPSLMSKANIVHFDYNNSTECISLTAQVKMPVPAPLPFVPREITLKSAASQPLVAKPPRGA